MRLWPKPRFILATSLLFGAVVVAAIPGMKIFLLFYLAGLGICFICLAALSCAASASAMRQASWRVAAIEATFAALVVGVCIFPRLLIVPLDAASPYLQLAIAYPIFKSRIAAWPSEATAKVLILETDGFLSSASGLAFDESGEMLGEPGTQSKRWKERASNSPLEKKCWRANRLVGFYYSWSGNYACE